MPGDSCDFRKNRRFLSLAVIYLVIIYGNSLQVPFLFDDRQNIVDRKELQVNRLSLEAVSATLTRSDKILRPLSYLSFGLNYYIGGHQVTGYHLINLAIHLVVTVFLYKTIVLLLSLSGNPFSEQQNRSVAALATILWAAHPVQMPAVTYIVQRMASLAAMFYIIGLWGYLHGRLKIRKETNARNGSVKWFVFSLIAFLAGVGSKENAVLFPVGILLVELFFFGGFQKVTKHPVAAFGTGALVLLATPVIGVVFFHVNMETVFVGAYDLRPFTLEQRLLTEPRVLFFYLSQLFYPVPGQFSMLHFVPLSESLFAPLTTFGAIAGILTAVLLSFTVGRKYPLIAFPVAFYIVHHLVESTLLSLEIVYEHRNYLPSLFLFLPLSVLVLKLLNFYRRRSLLVWGGIFVFATAVIFFLGLTVHGRNHDWRTVESFWKQELTAAPQLTRPYLGLGWYYTRPQRLNLELAAALFREGTTKTVYHNTFEKADLWLNLARVYKQRGDFEQAREYALTSRNLYQETIKKNSVLQNNQSVRKALAEGYFVLAQICSHLDIAEALLYINKSVRLHPVGGYEKEKGRLLLQAGHYDAALDALQKYLEIIPDDWQVFLAIGQAMTRKGDLSRGYWFYQQYLKKSREAKRLFSPLYLYLAENRYLAGAVEQGDAYLREFLALTPNHRVASVLEKMASHHPDMVPFVKKSVMLGKIRDCFCRKEAGDA